MPRNPRVEMAGYHHVINRGVEQRNVFLDEEDFDTFLQLLCQACPEYGVNGIIKREKRNRWVIILLLSPLGTRCTQFNYNLLKRYVS